MATQRADAVESKVSLLHAFGELLPDDTSVRSMSEHDILVAVVGDTVPDATSRSAGYLMAKAEGILAERQAAKKAIAEVKPDAVVSQQSSELSSRSLPPGTSSRLNPERRLYFL